MSGNLAAEDDCLNCIGKVSHNASLIDMVLCNVFRIVSGFDSDIAITIYYTPDASTVKFNLITKLMRKQCDKEEQGIINGIVASANKANKIRNELAHSFLHQSPTHGLQRVRPRDKQPKKPFTVAYLQSSTDDSMSHVLEAAHMYVQLCKKRGVPPQLKF